MSRISRMLIGAAIGAVAATAVNIISNGVGSSLNWSAQLVGYAAYAAPWLLIGAAIGYFGRFSAPKTNDNVTEANSPAVSRPANFKTMRVVKIIFGVLCLGIGVGLAVDAFDTLLHPPSPYSTSLSAGMTAMFAAMFLAGSYLLLRRSKPPIAPQGS